MNIRPLKYIILLGCIAVLFSATSCTGAGDDIELTVDYRWPELIEGVNYLKNTLHFTGRVSDPESDVYMYTSPIADIPVPSDAVKASVNGFDFEADLMLKPGKNLVTAYAENGIQTAERVMSVSVTDNGTVIYVTGKSDGTSLPWHEWIGFAQEDPRFIFTAAMKAGDRRTYDIQLNSNWGFSHDLLPVKCFFEIWRRPEPSRIVKEPLPEGMTLSIEPSELLAYRNTGYQLKLRVETSKELEAKTYYIFISISSPDTPNYETRGGIVRLVIEE